MSNQKKTTDATIQPMERNTEIIFFRESLLQSILADALTFGLIFGGLAFNHYILGGRWYVDVVFLFMALIMSLGRGNDHAHRFTSKQELKEYVDKL